MAKSVDAKDLFDRCMENSIHEPLTASMIATCLVSPFTIYFKDVYLMSFYEYY